MTKNSHKTDNIICIAALCYVILPVIIFLFGWTKIWVALIGAALFILLAFRLFKSLIDTEKAITFDKRFWILASIVLAVWVILSGIGGYAFQNEDFWARNPIYRDLSTYSWPVFYDLSKEPAYVQEICGTDTVAFSYYFSWWLPVALLSKIFRLGDPGRNFLLYLWAFIGTFLAVYLVCRKLEKTSFGIIAVFIGFSGLDAVPTILLNSIFNGIGSVFPWMYHIEWWAGYFQYSSNTTLLFWVFNQSIPIWILMGLFLQLKDNKSFIGLTSLSFAYSPWATLGMVPFAIAGTLKDRKKIFDAINIGNILSAVYMMIVYGLFYGSSTGSEGFVGLIFEKYSDRIVDVLFWYVLFVVFEFGIYYFILGKSARKSEYYLLTLAMLAVLPLVHILEVDFVMRASIIPLFMTMIYVLEFLYKKSESAHYNVRRRLLIIALCIGALTPLSEIDRSVIKTVTMDDHLEDSIGSLGYFEDDHSFYIYETRNQYFVYDYESTSFFRYIGK